MEKFSYPRSFILDFNSDKEKEYNEKLKLTKNVHKGQVKLFCNELLFILNHVYDGSSDKNEKLIVYVGAGPGYHIPLLVKMFPHLKWHLYDCRFAKELRCMKNVELFERYFEEKDIEIYKGMKKSNKSFDLYFISDIRDLSYNAKKQTLEEEMKIFNDMEFQEKWVRAIKAKYSMIKFRPPFPVPHVLDYLKKDYIEYLPGLVYKQPFAKITSVETRLVTSEKECEKTTRYYLKQYESLMFYHNAVYRNLNFSYNLDEFVKGVEVKENVTIDTRYDFASIVMMFYHYFMRLKKDTPQNTSKRVVKALKALWKTQE